ncbi:hypothetical protein [Amycolatopsis sp. NPDC051903]|uniref:hypothetical protein n=1 Tax=Amycolatopsis sp. NPDC051903 TaxID=3363936 RepID=UPI0037BB78A9
MRAHRRAPVEFGDLRELLAVGASGRRDVALLAHVGRPPHRHQQERQDRWADVCFAHRVAGGPPPAPNLRGKAKARHEWREWFKCVLACVIAVLLLVAIFVIGRPGQVGPLWDWPPLGALTGI